jgi:hypothetical protein
MEMKLQKIFKYMEWPVDQKEIRGEIILLESNQNENTTYQNPLDTSNVVPR